MSGWWRFTHAAAAVLHLRRRRLMAAAQDGFTALTWAVAKGHAECVRLLLDAGADKNARSKVRAGAGR